MKRIFLAAGALLIGTSALAWQPETSLDADPAKPVTVAVDPAVKTPPPKVVPKLATNMVKPEAASASWIADDQSLAETATPQPAAANYPPCSPGPGDDRCIQLYEPGVRAQLASYRPADTTMAGALGGPDTFTGVGGPDEGDLAMNGDGAVDAAVGEIAADEGGAAAYAGVGGPLEEVAASDYPPCSPGPGDDRCIQLYERGVTGR